MKQYAIYLTPSMGSQCADLLETSKMRFETYDKAYRYFVGKWGSGSLDVLGGGVIVYSYEFEGKLCWVRVTKEVTKTDMKYFNSGNLHCAIDYTNLFNKQVLGAAICQGIRGAQCPTN